VVQTVPNLNNLLYYFVQIYLDFHLKSQIQILSEPSAIFHIHLHPKFPIMIYNCIHFLIRIHQQLDNNYILNPNILQRYHHHYKNDKPAKTLLA
jgi:hypothetical protein